MIGIRPTINILEGCLQQRIDYYIIQDRFSFINLVNLLDGIDLPLDKAFSEAYELKTGNYHADGFYTWEYIRFLDIKRMNRVLSKVPVTDLVRNDNFTVPPKNLELAYELRQYRQRIVMNALRNSYSKITPAGQMEIIRKISKTFETDISIELVMSIYRDILSSPKFSFATLPGYYSDETEKLYYYPDIPGFRLMRNQEIRNVMGIRSDKSQTIY
jgi:anionic cell wall polymer biosynthesis LytR-Cps2A-Psr (LCP) family protein